MLQSVLSFVGIPRAGLKNRLALHGVVPGCWLRVDRGVCMYVRWHFFYIDPQTVETL